eukprot:CAMPEP_0203852316 /NCGR_PEP_ID=MMETSP0359-20131031/7849_1 /ASSEMBLY_ACC=CAM_ASM_000338 /TAXON_ID=268821 /ORGANISM="Scrippsiella Hangoei, Strain SHTV-5" /LENGTH=869 /DNA_ID=CAMNT_0050768445 /DNA_START=42 /DNA_END=2648 /DNA_ORIENTATION=-
MAHAAHHCSGFVLGQTLLLLLLLLLSGAMQTGSAVGVEGDAYILLEDYMSEDTDFFSKFDFWTGADPTHGAVDYVGPYEEALKEGLVRRQADGGGVYIGVDSRTQLALGQGRKSVRLQSKRLYNGGLFVISVAHAPSGCGVWPAFWMFGEDKQHPWPQWGELDIIEGAHLSTQSQATLHTGPGCQQSTIKEGADFSSRWDEGTPGGTLATNCDVHAEGQWYHQGCSQRAPVNTLGADFNSRGGGTWAAEWDPEGERIRIWFWPVGGEPRDLTSREPQPDGWGQPYHYFSLAPEVCPSHFFHNMRLVFDITFCGDLGTHTFADECGASEPSAATLSCEEFVAQHPFHFLEAYWMVRGLEVYIRRDNNQFQPQASETMDSTAETTIDSTAEALASHLESERVMSDMEKAESEAMQSRTFTTTTTTIRTVADTKTSTTTTPAAPSPAEWTPITSTSTTSCATRTETETSTRTRTQSVTTTSTPVETSTSTETATPVPTRSATLVATSTTLVVTSTTTVATSTTTALPFVTVVAADDVKVGGLAFECNAPGSPLAWPREQAAWCCLHKQIACIGRQSTSTTVEASTVPSTSTSTSTTRTATTAPASKGKLKVMAKRTWQSMTPAGDSASVNSLAVAAGGAEAASSLPPSSVSSMPTPAPRTTTVSTTMTTTTAEGGWASAMEDAFSDHSAQASSGDHGVFTLDLRPALHIVVAGAALFGVYSCISGVHRGSGSATATHRVGASYWDQMPAMYAELQMPGWSEAPRSNRSLSQGHGERGRSQNLRHLRRDDSRERLDAATPGGYMRGTWSEGDDRHSRTWNTQHHQVVESAEGQHETWNAQSTLQGDWNASSNRTGLQPDSVEAGADEGPSPHA